MYQNIFVDKKTETVFIWDDTAGLIKVPISDVTYAYRKRSGGRFKSLYGDELEKIKDFHPRDASLFESDVPLTTRVLIDAYEDSDEPSTGHVTLFLDIEIDITDGFSTPQDAENEVTAIALYDDVTRQYTALILDKNGVLPDETEQSGAKVLSFNSEESLLSCFLNKIEETRPTIVTGWNVVGFDMPYLINRITKVLGRNQSSRMSPINVSYISKAYGEAVVAGVSILDYMILYKKFIGRNEPSYALGAIAKRVVQMDKLAYDGNLQDLFRSDINKYIEYNLNDVKLVVAIDKKLKFIDLARNICHTGHVPYEYFGMSSRYIEGAMLMYLRRGGLVAPNKSLEGQAEFAARTEEGEEGFEGAFVKDPIPGRYDWVYDLDLTSMYPNIMISLNISPETVISKVDDWDVEKYLRNEYTSIRMSGSEYTVDEFKKMMDEKKFSIASNGVIYSNDKPGLIPSILIKWFDERKALRKKAKEFAEAGDTEQYEFYNGRQGVQKILLNSAYGVLGLEVFRFYNKNNAEAVTLTGQDIIKTTNKAINLYYKNVLQKDGDYVVYVDTDSAFASAVPIIEKTMPEVDLNDEKQMTVAILKVAGDVQLFVNKFYDIMAKRFFNIEKHRFDIKQEVISKSSFWLAKKRYCQLIINKAGLPVDELEIKGIDVVRTGFPAIFRKFMKEFIVDILKKVDQRKIDDDIIKFLEDINTLSVVELAKNTSVKFISLDKTKNYNPKERKPFQTMKGTPAQVKAALMYNDLLEKWELTKHVQPIFNGQKIKYLYMRDNEYGIDALAMKADGNDPKEILEFIGKYVDKMRMYDQELKTKLISFYEILKWDYPSLEARKSEQFFEF
jgi:DNA polymerase elongation subunit (family B)